jgi:hypothetical protein
VVLLAGRTLPEATAVLQITTATAERHWRYARAWLTRQLRRDAEPEEGSFRHDPENPDGFLVRLAHGRVKE